MKRSKLVAIIIGSVLGLGLIVGGFFFLQVFTRASSEKPLDVNQSEITSTSAKITWKTGNDTGLTIVTYSTSADLAGPLIQPSDSTVGKDHSAVLILLSPNTTYYYVIGDDKEFNNEGSPWSFTTKAAKETTTDLIVKPDVTATDSGALESENVPTSTPTPTPKATSSASVNTCTETNCAAIKAKLGKECSTQEYIKCIKAASNPSPAN